MNPILQKIKKLLTLARHASATEGEACNAMAAAQKLMTQNRLSIAEVDSASEAGKKSRTVSQSFYQFSKKSFYPWEKRLVSVVAKLCEVEAYLANSGPGFVGMESDAQIACEMYGYLHATALLLRKEYSKANPGERERIGGALFDESFMAGLTTRLYQRVQIIKDEEKKKTQASQAEKVTALVLQNKGLIRAWMDKELNLRNQRTSSGRSLDGASHSAGREAGNRISLERKRVLK